MILMRIGDVSLASTSLADRPAVDQKIDLAEDKRPPNTKNDKDL